MIEIIFTREKYKFWISTINFVDHKIKYPSATITANSAYQISMFKITEKVLYKNR